MNFRNVIVKYCIYIYLLIDILQFLNIIPLRPFIRILSNYIFLVLLSFYLLKFIKVTKDDRVILLFFFYNFINFSISFLFDNTSSYIINLLSTFPSVFLILSYFLFNRLDVSLKIIKSVVLYYYPIITIILLICVFNPQLKMKPDLIYFMHPFILFFVFILKSNFLRNTFLLLFIYLCFNSYPEGRSFLISLIFIYVLYLLQLFQIKNKLLFRFISYILILTPILFFIFIFFQNLIFEGDTRSFIFKEIYSHLIENNSLLFGTTPGLGYKTSLVEGGVFDQDGTLLLDYYDIWKNGRMSSEAGILNFLHWGGILNVMLFSVILLGFSRNILRKSKNNLCLILGVYVTFRWTFSFIDGSSLYTLQYLSLWFVLAFASSNKILSLSDNEINHLFKK